MNVALFHRSNGSKWPCKRFTGIEIYTQYEQYLSEFVYDKLWSELSAKDKMVARGIAQIKGGKISEIRELLHMETNEFNPYRKRLIRKGLIDGETRGYVKFSLPFFEEYVLEN